MAMTTTAAKTVRRTAKIAKPYTAALFRVYDKKTGVCLGYLSPSEDGKANYQITCDDLGTWHCTCLGNTKYHRRCQHIKAACELCEIRVKQGRPACRAASLPEPVETAKPPISDEQMAAIAAAAHQAVDETPVATEPARELRNVSSNGDLVPQYRGENGVWHRFKDEQGRDVVFIGGYEELARKFIAVDSDEHRLAVRAELQQMIADYVAAEDAREAATQSRDLVAVAATNAAQAGQAVDVLVASAPVRKVSSIEANLSPWLKAAMGGQSRNGQFSGRA